MRTPHTQTENRQTKFRAEIKLRGFFATAVGALLLFISLTPPALAVDAVWLTINEESNWNANDGWNPPTAPVNAGDTATFNTSTSTSIFLSANVTINSMTFNSGADAFLIDTSGHSFSFVGAGIVNNSAQTQTIVNDVGGSTNFLNSSTAGNVTIENLVGTTNFLNSSSAGNATILNFNSGSGTGTNFRDTSTAANANITNDGEGSATNFFNTSSAGNATILNDAGGTTNFFGTDATHFSTAGNATIQNDNGTTNFLNSSSAGNATIMNINSGSGAGITNFRDTSTAANANITNNGGVTNFFDTSTAGSATITNVSGETTFNNDSTAGSAIITNRDLSSITFLDRSSAGSATIVNSTTFPGTGNVIEFDDNSSAANATIRNQIDFGLISFFGNSSAGNATITSNGTDSQIEFQVTSSAANATIINAGQNTEIDFADNATAANATIINQGNGSFTEFFDSSSGGNARLINANPTASFDISPLTTGGTTAGSIEGNGTFFLGSKNLTVGGNDLSTTFSGVISDGGFRGGAGGSLTKVGTGTLTLTGANTYTGNTTVNAGSLIVDGSIASAQTFVNAGGLLGGGGIIGGDLTNGGIVSPGRVNSPGTLTVNGNYTQTANGTLRIEIAGTAPGQFDLLAVGGHASLAGTLRLIRLGNFQLQVGDKVTFLTAQGGVSGSFSTILNPFVSNTLVKAEINILGNAVQLEGTQGSFTEVACNSNTVAVGGALNSAVGDPRASGLIGFLDTRPLSELCGDLELIAPEELPAIFNAGVSLANIQTVNLERRMDDIRAGSTGFSARGFSINSSAPDFSPGLAGPTGPEGKSGPPVMQPTPENRWGVFVTGLGEFTSVGDTSVAPGYDFSTGGLTFGVDYRVSPNFAIGLTGGYAHTNANLVNNGSLDVNGGTIGAYATAFGGGFYVDAAAFGAFNSYDTHRTALLGTASGNTDGRDFNALVAAGYDWKSGGLTIGPTVSYQYTYVEFDGFTESGSLAPLTFNDQNANSSRTALGAKASYDWHVGHVVVKPELRAAWQHEFGDRDYSIVSRFANGAGNSFTVNGPAIGRDSLLIGAGAAVMFNDRVSVYAYYDGELARTNYSSNNVSAGVRISF